MTVSDATGAVARRPALPRSFAGARRSSYLWPVTGALVLPLITGTWPVILGPVLPLLRLALFLFLLWMPVIVLFKAVYEWTTGQGSFIGLLMRYLRPLPPGLVYDSDLKLTGFPVVTLSLIGINTFLFYSLPETAVIAGVFPPYGEPTTGKLVLTTFTSAFLHANFWHLIGNMVFLWAFGSAVEPRIGSLRYLWIYFLCILVSNLADVVLLNLQAAVLGSLEILGSYHSLGASGAIAGVMGLFAVRCYFARVRVSIPIFSLSFLSIPIRVQGIFLIGLFFALDVSGSVGQFAAEKGGVDYWAHVGGYLCGFCAGYLLKFHRDASREAVAYKAAGFRREEYGAGRALKVYGEILQQEPENEEALAYRLQCYHSCNREMAGDSFVRLVNLRARRDFEQAAALIEEYFPEYVNRLPGPVLLKAGVFFYGRNDLRRARVILEQAVRQNGPWQPKAMLVLADVFSDLGVAEVAECLLQEAAERWPGTDFGETALARLVERLSGDPP
jgi:membrane associated rhomboid family serine protease